MTNWAQKLCDTAMSMASNSGLIPTPEFYTMLPLCSLIFLKNCYLSHFCNIFHCKRHKIKVSRIKGEKTKPCHPEVTALKPLGVQTVTENKGCASFIRITGNLLKIMILGLNPKIPIKFRVDPRHLNFLKGAKWF